MSHFNPSDLPSPASFKHRIDLHMRFNDIDILGHLNNTVYFSYYDTGKAYYLEAVARGDMDWKRVEQVIANVDCSFLVPIYFGEDIEILTRCEYVGEKSFTLFQMLVGKHDHEVKSVCRSVMVSIDPDTKKSRLIPDKWRKGFAEYENTPISMQTLPAGKEQDGSHVMMFSPGDCNVKTE